MAKKTEVTTTLPALSPVKAQKAATTTSVEATELVIQSAEDVATATEIIARIKEAHELIDAEEAKVLDPIKEAIAANKKAEKAEKARWAPMRELYEAAETKLRADIMTYRKAEQLKLATATAKVNAAVASGRIKNEATAIAKVNAIEASGMGKSVSTGSAMASFKSVKKLKITDETKIPRAYMTPALKLIEAALKAGKSVPGAELAEEEQLAIR